MTARTILGRGALLSVVAALMLAGSAAAVTIKEFPVEGGAVGSHAPRYIHPGPDGNLWFTDGGTSGGIGRISTAGAPFAPLADPNRPVDFVVLPDGSVFWTSDRGCARFASGLVTQCTASSLAEYAVALSAGGELYITAETTDPFGLVCKASLSTPVCPAATAISNSRLTGLTLGSDGRLWAAAYEANELVRVRSDGTGKDLFSLPAGSGPARLALGRDGNLWVTMYDASAIDRITPTGDRTRFRLSPGSGPNDITSGPDGALWFTELKGDKIGRMTTSGVLTDEYDIPTPDSQPSGLTTGPDGAIWFTESKASQIGRLQLDPQQTGGGGNTGGGGGTGGSGGGTGGGTGSKLGAARLSSLHISPQSASTGGRRVRERCVTPTTGNANHQRCRRSIALRLGYTLTAAAKVTFTLTRQDPGRRVNGACVKPSPQDRHHKPCTRLTRIPGQITQDARAGANTLTLNGKIGGRALGPGSYQLTATPSHGVAHSVTFQITG